MKAEFTAIYETRPDGTVKASIAELPDVFAGGRTLEAARDHLARHLWLFLEARRLEALSRADPRSHIEPIQVESWPPTEAIAQARQRPWQRGEAEFWLALLRDGRIDSLLPLPSDTDDFVPISVEGKPISQQIIEDRR